MTFTPDTTGKGNGSGHQAVRSGGRGVSADVVRGGFTTRRTQKGHKKKREHPTGEPKDGGENLYNNGRGSTDYRYRLGGGCGEVYQVEVTRKTGREFFRLLSR